MLRTNPSFLSLIQDLYDRQERKDNILLKRFSPGNLLFRQGDRVPRVLVLKKGISKCFFNEENGKQYIVEFLGEGEVLGEIEAIRGINCLCNVETITEVEAYSISLPYFHSLMNENLQFNKMLISELAERIVNTSSRASFQQLYTVEHALGKLLELQAKHGLLISKEDMAAYLGITIRSLNRVLKGMKTYN
ncbi:Crp/Fnr family transcriptional regulator [Pedobacter sp. SYSU D00535]|uniref:Crp/Fnr family transcriptional regulator n=1 Tax=Pedobacter sp. SYSU D00535 TaxID=2810308 RepID=UPI001A96A8C3|nr:Crp/Fnr family transcriptional regulator [Pedobacter sp. SYSU D00535]